MSETRRPGGSSRATYALVALAALGLVGAVGVTTRTPDSAPLADVARADVSPAPRREADAPEPTLRGGGRPVDRKRALLRRRLSLTTALDERTLRRILEEFDAAGGPSESTAWLARTLQELSAPEERAPTVRRAAVALLGRLDRKCVPFDPFVRLYFDPDEVIRAEAVRGRARHGLKGYEDQTLSLTEDTDTGVRIAVAEALGSSQDERATTALLGLMFDAERPVARAAGASLGRAWRGALPERLVDAVASDDANARLAAAVALAGLRGERSTELLSGLCEDSDWQVREAAVDALGRAHSGTANLAAERLLEVACDRRATREDRFDALQHLGRLGDAAADPRIPELAASCPDPLLRVAACRTALAFGDAGSLDPLVALLDVEKGPLCDDEDRQFVQRAALETLRELTGSDQEGTDARSWRPVVSALRARSLGALPAYTPERLGTFR